MPRTPPSRPRLSRDDYRTLADLRYHIRRFLRVREVAGRRTGLEPQQYLVLLQLKGLEGHDRTTVSRLAERLQVRHHSAVGLVDRLAERGLVARRAADVDRRQVLVDVTPAGDAMLRRLVRYSIRELRTDGPALVAALNGLMRRGRARARRSARDGK